MEKTRFSNRANDRGGYHKRGTGDGDGGVFTAFAANRAKRASNATFVRWAEAERARI